MNEDINKLRELFSEAHRSYSEDRSKTFWVDIPAPRDEEINEALDRIADHWGVPLETSVNAIWNYPTNLPEQFPLTIDKGGYPTVTTTTTTAPVIPASTEKKDGNPKNSVGSTKFALSVVPTTVTAEVGLGMLEGARKYGRHNWREEGALASIYWDAANRHLIKWYEGEDIDPDSGLSHITKAICSLYVLRDAMIHGVMTDDRPPRSPDKWYEDLDAAVRFILEKYPDAKPAHTEKGE